MRWLPVLLLSACSCPPVQGYCPPSVRASDEVKADLMSYPLSGRVLDYLDLIGKQQATISVNCPQ